MMCVDVRRRSRRHQSTVRKTSLSISCFGDRLNQTKHRLVTARGIQSIFKRLRERRIGNDCLEVTEQRNAHAYGSAPGYQVDVLNQLRLERLAGIVRPIDDGLRETRRCLVDFGLDGFFKEMVEPKFIV